MNHRKHKDIALARRVEAERQAAQTPMLGWSTGLEQDRYIDGLKFDDAVRRFILAEKMANEWAESEMRIAQTAPADTITPEQLCDAFENAGVVLVQHKYTKTDEWSGDSEVEYWSYMDGPDHYRPAPGTSPEVLTAFYRQWDAIEAYQTTGIGWLRLRVSEKTCFGDNAAVYRLPADAKLIRPIPAKE